MLCEWNNITRAEWYPTQVYTLLFSYLCDMDTPPRCKSDSKSYILALDSSPFLLVSAGTKKFESSNEPQVASLNGCSWQHTIAQTAARGTQFSYMRELTTFISQPESTGELRKIDPYWFVSLRLVEGSVWRTFVRRTLILHTKMQNKEGTKQDMSWYDNLHLH